MKFHFRTLIDLNSDATKMQPLWHSVDQWELGHTVYDFLFERRLILVWQNDNLLRCGSEIYFFDSIPLVNRTTSWLIAKQRPARESQWNFEPNWREDFPKNSHFLCLGSLSDTRMRD